jgi:DNA-binding IclR family transcriptional regulator
MPDPTATPRRITPRRRRTRTERIMQAVLQHLADGHPHQVAHLPEARRLARSTQELHTIVHRMMERGLIEREGAGYHVGDPYRYRLAVAS